MPRIEFPDEIEKFAEDVTAFLSFFNKTASIVSEDEDNKCRTYRLDDESEDTFIIIQQSHKSNGRNSSEFRVSVRAPVASGLVEWLVGKEDIVNRFSTLGAYISSDGGGAVCSQALIAGPANNTLAGIVAASAVHARSSFLESVRRMLAREGKNIEQLSVWGDIDFEQIHYDFSHLGIGKLRKNGWTTIVGDRAILHLDAVHNNPYWGGGLLSILRVLDPKQSENLVSASDLNMLTYIADRTPMFGAWCKESDEYVFVQFAPNMFRGLPLFTDLLIEWGRQRATVIKDLIEAFRKQRGAPS